MTRAEIATAVRNWLVASGVAGGIPSPDARVIFADQTGPRPPKPYATVKVTTAGAELRHVEAWTDTSVVTPTWRARTDQRAMVSVNAFGEGAEEWLRRAALMLYAPSIKQQNTAAGVAIWLEGSVRDLSSAVSDRFEARYQADFRVDYVQTESVTSEAGVPLAVVEHTDTYLGGSPDDLVVTNTEVLP
ncbi:MAG: hypothetical protein HOP09_14645 [Hyphomicrobium sp.]|nr:hypothetical protein [Hyphomicrobium sp.]